MGNMIAGLLLGLFIALSIYSYHHNHHTSYYSYEIGHHYKPAREVIIIPRTAKIR